MRKKFTLIMLLLFAACSAVLAQSIKISGKVTDNAGQSLPGVTVAVKGTQLVTTTNPEGRYSVTAPGNAILSFSFIGYVRQEVPVNSAAVINIVLLDDNKALNEVVVVGYGSQKSEKSVGSDINYQKC